MTIPYNPKDADPELLVAGIYPAVLAGCEEKQSKAGNNMYELSISVFAGIREVRIREFIVFPTFTWKLKRLAQAFGLEDIYNAGTFTPEECLGKNFTVEIVVEHKEGQEPQNRIKAYAKSNGPAPVFPSSVPAGDFNPNDPNDDGLPF